MYIFGIVYTVHCTVCISSGEEKNQLETATTTFLSLHSVFLYYLESHILDKRVKKLKNRLKISKYATAVKKPISNQINFHDNQLPLLYTVGMIFKNEGRNLLAIFAEDFFVNFFLGK